MLRRSSSAGFFVIFALALSSVSKAQITEEFIKQLPPVAQKEVRGCCSELLTGQKANVRWDAITTRRRTCAQQTNSENTAAA